VLLDDLCCWNGVLLERLVLLERQCCFGLWRRCIRQVTRLERQHSQ
jgi:hypothetical protein